MRGSRSCSDGRLLRWLSMLRSCVLVTTVAWVVVVVPLAHGLVTPCRALLYSGTTTMTRWQQPQPQEQSSSGHWWHPRRSSLGLNSRNSRRKTPATATPLSMHMGHSHSHHHDHHPNERNGAVGLELRSPSPTARVAWFGKKRRLAGMLLFCALAILGPPLLYYRRVVTTSDVAAFVGTATCVAAAEPLRNFIQLWIQRLRNLGQGISKHSTPITASYLFQNKNAADRITLLGGVMNIVLSIAKFAVGVTCHSSALIADAGHSLSDLFSDFVTLWAVQVARLPPDQDHPYGHGKFEAVGSLFLSLTLIATALGVGAMSNSKLLEVLALQRSQAGGLAATAAAYTVPGLPALLVAFISVLSKEWLFRVTRNVGEQLQSQIVIANAWHHRSDAYSSILATASIGLAMYVPNMIFADAAAGLFVAAMIGMTGMEILGESVKQLTDHSNDELVQKVTSLAEQNVDVESVVNVRARQVGSAASVDIAVSMPEERTASAARAVEERIKRQILQQTEAGTVLDVNVRATAASPMVPAVVICPLLEARMDNSLVSAKEVELCVRDEILSRHPEVASVQGVTVHYQNTSLLVNVDVDIRLRQSAVATTIASVETVANDIRKTLEISNQINKARIFLDLNIEE